MWVHPAAQLHEEDRLHQHYVRPGLGLAGSTSLVVLALNSLSFWFHLKTRFSPTDFYVNLIVVPYRTWKKSLPEKFCGGKKVTLQFFSFFFFCLVLLVLSDRRAEEENVDGVLHFLYLMFNSPYWQLESRLALLNNNNRLKKKKRYTGIAVAVKWRNGPRCYYVNN